MKKKKIYKKLYYWVEGDEGSGDKLYLGSNPKYILYYLKVNDPILCGTNYMTKSQFRKLKSYD